MPVVSEAAVVKLLTQWNAVLATDGAPWLVVPAVLGRGPLVIGMGTATDPVLVFGYNHQANYTVATAGEPGLAWMIEGDYDDGTGQHKMEGYLQYLFADGSGRYNRAFMTMVNRVTNLPVETALSGGSAGVTIYQNVGAGTPGTLAFVLGTMVAKFLSALTTIFSPLTVTGTVDGAGFKVNGVAGVSFGPAHPASITVVNGIVVACS